MYARQLKLSKSMTRWQPKEKKTCSTARRSTLRRSSKIPSLVQSATDSSSTKHTFNFTTKTFIETIVKRFASIAARFSRTAADLIHTFWSTNLTMRRNSNAINAWSSSTSPVIWRDTNEWVELLKPYESLTMYPFNRFTKTSNRISAIFARSPLFSRTL